MFFFSQAVCWTPFFLHLLALPWLSSPLPAAVSVSATLLGYAQCALTPVLVLVLMDRVRNIVCYSACCK